MSKSNISVSRSGCTLTLRSANFTYRFERSDDSVTTGGYLIHEDDFKKACKTINNDYHEFLGLLALLKVQLLGEGFDSAETTEWNGQLGLLLGKMCLCSEEVWSFHGALIEANVSSLG
ncbi:MAG: hypothetical protein Q9208_001405 [Pyrenodesmia sp. 3 TL-2023]